MLGNLPICPPGVSDENVGAYIPWELLADDTLSVVARQLYVWLKLDKGTVHEFGQENFPGEGMSFVEAAAMELVRTRWLAPRR